MSRNSSSVQARHEVTEEELILVDEFDTEIGTASRRECHAGEGLRHRAFVVFLFDDDGKLLLQHRSGRKLGGGRWDVSATSHVRKGETYESAIARCLRSELGLSKHESLRRILSYVYTERLGGVAENEFCVLFTASLEGSVEANPDEIDQIRFATIPKIVEEISRDPARHTKWLREALDSFLRHRAGAGSAG